MTVASFAPVAAAQTPVPALSARVVDPSAVMGAPGRAALEERLARLERERGSQVVVLVQPSVQPEDIADYAHRVASSWKIGRRGIGDGVLIVVAVQDRRIRIEVAKALEGAIPDLAARRIIDESIAPAFRRGDYSGGLIAAADRLDLLISGEGLPAPGTGGPGQAQDGFNAADLFIFLLFAVPIIATVLRGLLGRRVGALLTGGAAGFGAWWLSAALWIAVVAAVLAALFALLGNSATPARRGRGGFTHMGGGGTGGDWGGGFDGAGGDGGGGFSSGGGGDFGGGGASGDW